MLTLHLLDNTADDARGPSTSYTFQFGERRPRKNASRSRGGIGAAAGQRNDGLGIARDCRVPLPVPLDPAN
jgi:hypothetical protein